MHRPIPFLLLCLLLVQCNRSGQAQEVRITDSGGVLLREQAAYDVTFYDLALAVDPDARALDGVLTVQAAVVHPLDWFVLDLDTVLAVSRVELIGGGDAAVPLAYARRGGKLWSRLERTRQPGEAVTVRVHYGGAPRVAPHPPWSGGFTWAQTADGRPWVATSVQGEGADLWWPCKDHPSDEPDSMALHISVPEGLVVASNGRLREVTRADGRATYHWFVSTPINNYGVALNIAPYRTVTGSYHSVAGDVVPVTFWVLPEHEAEGRRLFPQLLEHLAFYEKLLGPYPFRADKYGVAETPFLGMEHQTIIAYGSDFSDAPYGYDWLHHHELGHEWWGNLVTAFDWRDFWIHEGFCTYMQALYAESLFGAEGYRRELMRYRPNLLNRKPLAPRASRTTDEMYFVDAGRGIADNDIYYKGAWVLHSLRYLIGDDALFTALRRMAYPTPEMEQVTDGRQCRFATTDDFIRIAEAASGRELDWFFEVYLRQPDLPELVAERTPEGVALRWRVPGGLPFSMPVDVQVGDTLRRIALPEEGPVVVPVPAGVAIGIDPGAWVLRKQ